MSFEELLQRVVRGVEGAQAAVLMGFDGIAVAEYRSDSSPSMLQETAVEYSRILSESTKIAQANDLGALTEISLVFDRYRLIFRVVNPNYFVLLWLSADSILGKGRYLLRASEADLQSQL